VSQHLTVIHKSNVLSITDGLFRETVCGVPNLPGINGKYDGVTIMEQLVDSAVYRYVLVVPRCLEIQSMMYLGYSASQSESTILPMTPWITLVTRVFDVMVAPNLYGDILS